MLRGGIGGGEGSQEGGDTRIIMAGFYCYTVETNTTL